MAMLYVDPIHVKKETANGFLLQCPASSYSYANMTFWVSKKQASLMRCGRVAYLQVYFYTTGQAELHRYRGRNQLPFVTKVPWVDVVTMFSVEHETLQARLQWEYENQAADRLFEAQQREYEASVASSSPFNRY